MKLIKTLYQFFSIKLILFKVKPTHNWGNLLISTKKGFYQLNNKKLSLVERGEFYGLTIKDDKCFIFKRLEVEDSVIIEFKLIKGLIDKSSRKTLCRNLDFGGHQMDFFLGHIYLTDTNYNSVLKIDLSGNLITKYYPIGKLKNGRESDNYGHINSISSDGKYIYILCHNDSINSGRNSEILKVDFEFNLVEKISTNSKSAHNVIFYNNSFYHCNSIHSTLIKDDSVLFKANNFTRGISITKENIILGESEYASRNKRTSSRGFLFLLKHDGTLIESIIVPGMVQEVRTIDQKDYGLSDSNF